ncbi:hypothetical protein ACFQVA_07920 [Actinomadura keratinilytica]
MTVNLNKGQGISLEKKDGESSPRYAWGSAGRRPPARTLRQPHP